jgi:lipopolysaccharide transport system ATP-binding protein
MSKPIIAAEGLGKAYRIGHKIDRHQTFGELFSGAIRSPWKQLKKRISDRDSNGDTFWAIKDINFTVDRGEVIGLIGRNGAGKSTLLKVLSRITEPTEGHATLRGRVASLLEVGTGFHPELTGRENIFLNGAILGMRKTEISRKFDDIVEFSEVGKFLDTPVKRYSSGMYVRLAFAVAAHLEPEILIVDEVLAVGDAQFQKKCLGKMGDAVKTGRTVLFVSHNMDAVLTLCNSVLVVDGGRISERMSTNDGVKEYLAAANREDDLPLSKKPRFQAKTREPIFTDLKVTSDSGHGNVVECGGGVTFEITISNCADLHNVTVAVALLNERSQRIMLVHSEYQNKKFFNGAASKKIICKVPSLPLTPGAYSVELVMGDTYSYIERVERADRLNVIFADYLGTGMLPKNHQCQVVLPATWEEVRA